MFKEITAKPDFPKLEEEILKFWKKEKIFEKSVKSRSKSKSWTFLDGPPFITGLPHYGSLLSSIPKDLFPRFWTMKGYRVRRVWGWDCHGLPAENKVEGKLGIKRKRDIEEKVGVKKFIDECKHYVSKVSSEWEWYIDKVARWVDFKNAYKTMDLQYMETVMWVFKKMYEKGLIYKGLRVSLYCPHCSTPISNFEVAMDADNYKTITEPSNVYKYQLKDEKNTYFLAWSTTPWNKIVTPALAVNPKLIYVKVQQGSERYIVAKDTLGILKEEPPYKVVEEIKGEKLLGLEFVPHFNFYKIDQGKKAFIVIGGDFVTADEGTGIVTIAAYGEEDLDVMKKEDIQIFLHVDDEGNLLPAVPKWGGMNYLKVNPLVNEDLKSRGLLYREDQHTHSIPMCWRCHTRLFHNPQVAWYVDIQKIKSKLIKTNEFVNWYPEHFKHGRFLKSVQAAPDWCISRSRYWGSPVPVWECSCGERFVPGSIAELEEVSGKKVNSLHKPDIDEVTIKCKKCNAQVKRVPEVLDSWIEAGSAPYAERHYPFNKDQKLEDFFPPDFIVEYTGQIRAWFYVLHVIATAIFGSNAFKNVVVTGVILGSDGRKMSKNYGNFPDPKEMLEVYGGDALRLYLMGSSVMHGEDILISEEQYRNQVKLFLLPLWNIYNFFVTYANLDNWYPKGKEKIFSKILIEFSEFHVLDRWILGVLNELVRDVKKYLDDYDTVKALKSQTEFIKDFSTWYIRRSRGRVGSSAPEGKDKTNFYETCSYVLVTLTKTLAPFVPFISEYIYKTLTTDLSVHLEDFPDTNSVFEHPLLLKNMVKVRELVENARALRKEKSIKVRQPLKKLSIRGRPLRENMVALIKDEVNVKEVIFDENLSDEMILDTTVTPKLKAEGEARGLIRKIQNLRKEAGCKLDAKVLVFAPSWPKDFEEYIKTKTLAKEIKRGETLKIEI